jgi:hypothetical protein
MARLDAPGGRISSYRWQDNSASGMPPVAAFYCNQQNGLLSNKQGDIYKITKKSFEVAETLLPDPLG